MTDIQGLDLDQAVNTKGEKEDEEEIRPTAGTTKG